MTLTWADYLVIGGYLLAITLFGSWFARFQHTTRDYFLTDRSVPWWAVCFTVVATETSTLTFIGVPAAAYAGNFTFLQLAAGYILGRLAVSALFIPAYFRGELFTSYQLLQRRFGSSVTTLAAIIFLGTRSLADGVRLFATALVIAVVTQLPVTWVVVVLGVAMIVYTVRGGAAAVIWTDVVQMFVYAAGALLAARAVYAGIDGGWATIARVAGAAGKFTVLDPSFDPSRPYTLWAGLAGGIALTLATHGTDQFHVQRLLAARSARDAARGLVLSGFLVFAQFALFLLLGAMLFVYYTQTPLPRPLSRPDDVLPLFIVSALPHGLAGFIVAAIVAAALSPSLNAMAATTVNDLYLRYVRPDADQPRQMRVSKLATIGWGVVQLLIAIAAQWMDRSVLDAGLSVLSFASGAILGAFLLGTLSTAVDGQEVLAGMLAGLAATTAAWWWTTTAFTWYVPIGAATTCGTAWLLHAGRAMAAARAASPAEP